MRAAYDQIAAEFAERNAAVPPVYLQLCAQFLVMLGRRGTILDLGCGVGRDMAWFEEEGAVVVGADLSAGMLVQARPRVLGDLLQLDMRNLPFRPEVFAGVWCSASLLHLPKADASSALAEMHRVLGPRGVLFLGIQRGEGEGWERGPYGAVERFFARYSLAEAEALLYSSGFMVVGHSENESPGRHWLNFLGIRADS